MKPILFNTEMVRAILEGRKTVTRRVVKIPEGRTLVAPVGKDSAELGVMCMRGVAGGIVKAPYKVNDILYVRETWTSWSCAECDCECVPDNGSGGCTIPAYLYAASDERPDKGWKPSIHMPKKAARIFLRVTDVRVERLQDITEEQAIAEGIVRLYDDMSKEEYEAWAKRTGKSETQKECPFINYLWHGNYGKYGSGNKLSDAWNYQYSGYKNAIGSFSSLWNTTVDLKKWATYGWDANPYVWVIEFERITQEQAEGKAAAVL